MDSLPVELAYAIFAQLKARKKNKQDLASCSLVSRRWRQITLPQLFEKLRITSRVHDYSKEACPAESEDWHRSSKRITTLPSVLTFLTRRPDIAVFVHSLDLTQDDWTTKSTDPKMLRLIFNQLPSLRNVELTNVCVGETFGDPSIEHVVDRHLDRLRISLAHCIMNGYPVPPTPCILRTISFFRSIDMLSLRNGYYRDKTLVDDRSTGLPLLSLPAPKQLEIGNSFPLHLLVPILNSHSLLQNIETLIMGNMKHAIADDKDVQAIEYLLTYVSATLLYFAPPQFEHNHSDVQSTLLSPLRKLETLYLTIWTVEPTTDWLDATHLLRSTIPTLRTVLLDVQVDLGTQTETKWYLEEAASCITHLEDILLALAASGSLNRVILYLTDRYNSAMKRPFRKVIFHFGKIFPRLRKQGIVECIRLKR